MNTGFKPNLYALLLNAFPVFEKFTYGEAIPY
jgi:hypothetical protein